MTAREKKAVSHIAAVVAGWLMAIAAVTVILTVQGVIADSERIELAGR